MGGGLTGRVAQMRGRARLLLSKSIPGISSEQESAWVKVMAIALPVLCLDAGTKAVIAGSYELGVKEEGRFFTILHAHNPGVNYVLHNLGVMPGKVPIILFVGAGIAASIALFRLAPQASYGWIPTGLALGGVLGNELDVIAHGYGTDFIYIKALEGTANVADVAMAAAAIASFILLIQGYWQVRSTKGDPPSASSEASAT